MQSEKVNLFGDGLSAYVIAYMWGADIAWQKKNHDNFTLLPNRPLLIHANNFWLVQELGLVHHDINNFTMQNNGKNIQTWHSSDFDMTRFASVINPNELFSKLYQATSFELSNQVFDKTIIATGKFIPEKYAKAYREYKYGKMNHDITETLADDFNSMVINWQNDKIAASIANTDGKVWHINSFNSLDGDDIYCRCSIDKGIVFLGESLLRTPPILASGLNTTLKILKKRRDKNLSWHAFRSLSHSMAVKQFVLNSGYKMCAEKKFFRSIMQFGVKQSFLMRMAIKMVLDDN